MRLRRIERSDAKITPFGKFMRDAIHITGGFVMPVLGGVGGPIALVYFVITSDEPGMWMLLIILIPPMIGASIGVYLGFEANRWPRPPKL